MSRRAGQVTGPQALGGLAITGSLIAAVIALCTWLLVPGEAVPPLDAPGPVVEVDDADECADPPSRDPGAQPVTSSQLFDCPEVWDGRLVAYEGEAVGAVLRRGDRAWVQLNDDPYALRLGPLPQHRTAVGGNAGVAVSIPASAAEQIDHVGGAGVRGDQLAIVGTYFSADPRDGGGAAIQAEAVVRVRQGEVFADRLSMRRAMVAVGLLIAAAALGFAAWRRQRAVD